MRYSSISELNNKKITELATCSYVERGGWHARLRGGVHADAIMDRIVHTATWLESGEINMRAKLSSSEG